VTLAFGFIEGFMSLQVVARRRALVGLLSIISFGGCQTNLPALDNYPGSAPPAPPRAPRGAGQKPEDTPKATDVVIHIQCELAKILNTVSSSPDVQMDAKSGAKAMKDMSPEFVRRLQTSSTLTDASKLLLNAHFVASVQLTLEVTDVQGFTPSLTFQNAIMGHHTGSVGGQLNGTQDRNISLNYAVDLAELAQLKTNPCDGSSWESTQSGVQGDLGLADIVADGLIALSHSESTNLYSSTGPAPITSPITVSQYGTIELPYVPASPRPADNSLPPTPADSNWPVPSMSTPIRKSLARTRLTIDSLQGTMVLAPQSAYVQTQGSVYFNGLVSIDGDNYIASWTGSLLPTNSITAPLKFTYFTLSGALSPDPAVSHLEAIERRWGFNPTITLTGSIEKRQSDGQYLIDTLKLAGTVAPAATSDYARALTPIEVKLWDSGPKAKLTIETNAKNARLAAASVTPSSKPTTSTATASASSGGTSFGSLVDFTLVWGLNGSPLFTWQHLVGFASAANPLLNVTHTSIDSMAITFVPSCRDKSGGQEQADDAKKTTKSLPGAFWDTLPYCDDLPSASQIGASIGYQNNQLMILRQPFNLPRPQ
jgi:hypothetical protein